MPYRKRIPKGKKWNGKSWTFDLYINGIRYKKDVKVENRHEVDEVYCSWASEMRRKYNPSSSTNQPPMLFDTLYKFLEWARSEKKNIQPKSIERYENFIRILRTSTNDRLLSEVYIDFIDDYKKWRRVNTFSNQSIEASDATINRDLAVLSYFFNWCIQREIYKRPNPVIEKYPENVREILLTNDQINEIISKSYGHVKTAVMLSLFTGMRKGEICQLHWKDVDYDNNTIFIPKTHTKNKRSRKVYFIDVLRDHLRQVQKESASEYVISFRGKPIKEFKKTWQKIRSTFSFPVGNSLHFHDLRHIHAQLLKNKSVPMIDIKDQLGHTEIKTTAKYYANIDSTGRKREIQKLAELELGNA
jgi:integrase